MPTTGAYTIGHGHQMAARVPHTALEHILSSPQTNNK